MRWRTVSRMPRETSARAPTSRVMHPGRRPKIRRKMPAWRGHALWAPGHEPAESARRCASRCTRRCRARGRTRKASRRAQASSFPRMARRRNCTSDEAGLRWLFLCRWGKRHSLADHDPKAQGPPGSCAQRVAVAQAVVRRGHLRRVRLRRPWLGGTAASLVHLKHARHGAWLGLLSL